MATVYLAHDQRHNRNVALKVLKAELAAVVGAERFLAEIETTAKLTHPHILPLFDSGQAESFLYYVMPYVEGESLRDRSRRHTSHPRLAPTADLQFTGYSRRIWPTILAGSAPGIGSNFCTRPAKQSAR